MKKLVALPALIDNYIWMLHDGREAIVVDPGDASVVERELDEQGLRLAGILVTHHHSDHIGGVDGLRRRLNGPVYGPVGESIPQPFASLTDGDRIHLLGWEFEVLSVPGHTKGHIAYLHRPADDAPILFCGDTLFSGGCGRLFEGTAEQLHASIERLASLPGPTRVCCGHEYTLGNLRFARAVEPDNAALNAYAAWCECRREAGQPTLPSHIARERDINPFLRCRAPGVQRAAREHGAMSTEAVTVFATLRQWKNEFR